MRAGFIGTNETRPGGPPVGLTPRPTLVSPAGATGRRVRPTVPAAAGRRPRATLWRPHDSSDFVLPRPRVRRTPPGRPAPARVAHVPGPGRPVRRRDVPARPARAGRPGRLPGPAPRPRPVGRPPAVV